MLSCFFSFHFPSCWSDVLHIKMNGRLSDLYWGNVNVWTRVKRWWYKCYMLNEWTEIRLCRLALVINKNVVCELMELAPKNAHSLLIKSFLLAEDRKKIDWISTPVIHIQSSYHQRQFDLCPFSLHWLSSFFYFCQNIHVFHTDH